VELCRCGDHECFSGCLDRLRLNYTPQPRQLLFHQTKADQILYGGAAGGGKSHCLRWDAIDFCLKIPNLNATLFRRTLPMLLKNHIVPLRRELPSSMGLGSYNETRKTYEFRNGSILSFQHIEYDRDCDDIQGAELHWAGIDEAGQMTPYMLSWIQSRVRLGEASQRFAEYVKLEPKLKPYVERLPRLAMSSNPGGESHHYLKEMFIDPAPPETMFPVEHKSPLTGRTITKTRIFIPARMLDNQYLDADYEGQFSGMPEWQQKQLIEGDWNVVPGAFFDCWNTQNLIRPFKVPDHWTRLWSCDWGFRQPFWIGEWVVSDGTFVHDMAGQEIKFPEGCLILVREWYGQEKGNKGIRMNAFDVGKELRSWREPEIRVADPSMWRSDSGPSPAERMAQAGIFWQKADNEREAGWQEMYARIKDKMLLSFDTNFHFNRVIPTLEHDEKKLEDVAKKGEDHPGDGGRYACMARPYKKDRPVEKKPWWQDVKVPTFNEVMNSRYRSPNQAPEII
jgi:hypothetical protein